jgi:hypothetical protein
MPRLKNTRALGPSLDLKSCTQLRSDIPTITIHRPESGTTQATLLEISIRIEDDVSLTSPSASLFDSSLNSSTSAVDSTEVPDLADCCNASVSSVSVYSQDDLPFGEAIKLPEVDDQSTKFGNLSSIPECLSSASVSMSGVLEEYDSGLKHNNDPESEEDFDSCSIISDEGGVQEEYKLAIDSFDKRTLQIAAEFRRKSQLVQAQCISQVCSEKSVAHAGTSPSAVDGDSSLLTKNSTSTISVDSDQFKYDSSCGGNDNPEGTSWLIKD